MTLFITGESNIITLGEGNFICAFSNEMRMLSIRSDEYIRQSDRKTIEVVRA